MAGSQSMSRSYDDDDDFYNSDDKLIAIHTAIINNDVEGLREACLASPDSVNLKFTDDIDPQHNGMTPISLAAALNHNKLVKVLLRNKGDVNATFANLRTTALMTSAFHGHTEIVDTLLKHGANAKAVDLQGSTALGYCFGGSRKPEVVNLLIDAGVDVNYKNMLGMNALLLVAGYGNEPLVRIVLAANADPNSTNEFGHTSLHLAVVGKRSQIGATIVGQSTPLYGLNRRNLDQVLKDWANRHRDVIGGGRVDEKELEQIGQFMMHIGEKLVDDQDGLTCDDQEAVKKRLEAVHRYRQELMLSTKNSKKPGMVDTLLSCGGRRSKQAKAANGNSAPSDRLTSAPISSSGNPEEDSNVEMLCDKFSRIVRLLLDSGCKVDITEKTFGMTALDMAILLGDVESTVLLTAAGGDANHLMKLFALSDLYCNIAIKPDKKLVKELLASDPHLDVNGSFTNFNVTKKTEEEEMLEKSDGYPRGDDGLTPLGVAGKAMDNRTVDIINILIKHDANINKIGTGGRSTLGEAVRLGNVKMVEFLVLQGADIETPNPAFKNATPVMIAVICKQTKIVEYLLSEHAKIDLHMSDGRTALDKAMETSDMPMIDTILEHSDLSRNFFDPQSLTYRMTEMYKHPDRNIESILNEISRNVRAIAEKEEEDRRHEEQMKAQEQESHTRTMTPVSESSVSLVSPSREAQQREAPRKPTAKTRSKSRRSETDSVEEQLSFVSATNQTPPQVTENNAVKGKKVKAGQKGRKLKEPKKPVPPVDSGAASEEAASEESEVEVSAPIPAPAKRQTKQSKKSTTVEEQPPPVVEVKQDEAKPIKAQKSSKKAAAVPKPEPQKPVAQQASPVASQPTKKVKSSQQPPVTLPPKDDEDESEEEESEEESEEEPQLQLATNAGLKGVAKYPPSQQVTSSSVRVVRTANGAGASTVTSSKTTVTKTVTASSRGVTNNVNTVQSVRAEEEDDESEEESEEEDENLQDVNSNVAKMQVTNKSRPAAQSHKLNRSAETDI